MKKKLIALLILAGVIVGGVFLVKKGKMHHGHDQPPLVLPVVVEARLLERGHTRLTVPTVAEVQSLRDAVVASRLSAYITELPLFEGDRFKRGAVLARLDPSQAEADLQRAEAGLAQSRLQEGTLAAELAAADSTLKAEQERVQRLQALHKIGGVALEQVQAAEASLAAARARQTGAGAAVHSYQSLLKANQAGVAAAHENLRYGVITAPFDGVVSQRLAQPGDLATPGKPLLKITDLGAGVRLLVNVPEASAPVGLYLGDKMFDLRPWPEAGAQGLRRFEARAPAGAFLPGARVDARLVMFRSPEAVLLPRQCLLNDDGQTATVAALAGDGPVNASSAPAAGQHPHPAQDAVPPVQAHASHQAMAATGKIEALKIALTAEGEEGAASLDPRLAGRRVVCASPDVLTRLLAGVPFSVRPAR